MSLGLLYKKQVDQPVSMKDFGDREDVGKKKGRDVERQRTSKICNKRGSSDGIIGSTQMERYGLSYESWLEASLSFGHAFITNN